MSREITLESGLTNLGKYTLPKIWALDTNVEEVLVRQSAKYPQHTIPAM